MKIAYLTGSLPPTRDGVADWSKNVIEGFEGSKFEVTIVTSSVHKPYLDENNLNNITLDDFSLKSVIRILKILKSKSFDVINIEYPCVGYQLKFGINLLPFLLKTYLSNTKIALSLHEYAFYTWKGKLRKNVMLYFSDLVFLTDRLNFRLVKVKKSARKVLLYVPPQIPIQSKKTKDESSIITIGYWGFVRQRKGLDLLVKSLSHLMKSGVLNVQLKIYAELLESDDYHLSIMKLIKEENLENHIIITGYLSENDLSIGISEMDLCVLPYEDGVSDRRGTFVAAMAQGVSVITTIKDKDLIPDNLSHLENIFLINYDKYELSNAILYLINESALREKLGSAAKKWASSRTWEEVNMMIQKELEYIILS